MELFDTHFHLDGDVGAETALAAMRADWARIAERFREPLTRLYLLCAGGTPEESSRARKFAEAVPDGYFAAGIHPHEAAANRRRCGEFAEFRGHAKLKAVGEIGLDYFYDFSEPAIQREVLAEFLALALEWDLPAMLHLRDRDGADGAYRDALEYLRDFAAAGGRFVVHCYAGDAGFAEKFLELGGYFGVTGLYTFKAASNVREALARIPTERLLIETDSPYLTPVPYRGRPNTPAMVGLVAERLGADRGMTPEEAAAAFTANGKRFYNIG
ncbi:MAG: TatD family hydrolase [Lentisphaeria bacterium]|nr:TatD family hydrolase [Lentisphaeria bacterium]